MKDSDKHKTSGKIQIYNTTLINPKLLKTNKNDYFRTAVKSEEITHTEAAGCEIVSSLRISSLLFKFLSNELCCKHVFIKVLFVRMVLWNKSPKFLKVFLSFLTLA